MALDAQYFNREEDPGDAALTVRVAGVSFEHIHDSEPVREQVLEIAGAARQV